MYKLYCDFLRVLSSKRKKQLFFLIVLMFFNSFAEVVSVFSVVPFLIVISSPEKLLENNFISSIFSFFGIVLGKDLLLPITLFFVFTIVVSGLIRLTNLWLAGRISTAIGTDISFEIYRRTLFQEYPYHLQKNSSEIITVLTSYMYKTISVIRTILNLLTSIFISFGVIISLFFVEWRVAISSIFLFGIFYLLLAFLVRPLLLRNSRIVAEACEKQIRLLQDSLGSIKDIILDSNQIIYLNIFKRIDRSAQLKANQNQYIGGFPKYLFELIGFSVIALLAFFLVMKKDAGVLVIPILGAFALGAQKLLPSLQQIYNGWSTINSSLSELNIIIKMLNQSISVNYSKPNKSKKLENIIFKDVSFKYSEDSKNVLNQISFEIYPGKIIGLIGKTGTGKSTLMDVLMGLLKPTDGKILINGKDIYDKRYPQRIYAWRNQISHVPQNIFVSNSSIKENIAFGIEEELIDIKKLELASRQAGLYDFIKKSKQGFGFNVGERGSSLSGGQLQRLGIARALYRDSPVLILDEATSALDIETEKEIMDSIVKLKKNKVVILISHKESTLKYCDKVLKISKGSIIENI